MIVVADVAAVDSVLEALVVSFVVVVALVAEVVAVVPLVAVVALVVEVVPVVAVVSLVAVVASVVAIYNIIRYSLSRKTEDFLRFRSIFGSWRGGGLFCSCSSQGQTSRVL
ncbi:hypothetical protein [Ruminococcus sp.]